MKNKNSLERHIWAIMQRIEKGKIQLFKRTRELRRLRVDLRELKSVFSSAAQRERREREKGKM